MAETLGANLIMWAYLFTILYIYGFNIEPDFNFFISYNVIY